jgi:hypothetical protein
MNAFVEQCLREWKRLGVPDLVANEMAADLDADLRDAAADNVAPEEVLGNAIFDAQSFARSWAEERGVTPPAHVPVSRSSGLQITAIVLAGLAVLGAGLLALVIFHPTARAMVVGPTVFKKISGSRPTTIGFPPPTGMVQHAGIGAPLGVLAVGLVVIALLSAGAWVTWRRA